jgi:hypothetical protein
MSAAPALLSEVLEVAGGESRWRRLSGVSARVRTGGLLPRTRMPGNRLADYVVTIAARAPRALLDPFPGAGTRGVFEAGEVRIEDAGGRVLARREGPRSYFFGRSGLRRNLRWDALDSTYFAGYAMWNYLLTPGLLLAEGVELREAGSWEGRDGRRRRLQASFPAELPTHSPSQTFHVDDRGRIVRHDYVAEVIGRWARGAHHCSAHREFDGLLFPTRRRVVPRRRGGRSLPGPTLVSLEVVELEARFAEPAGEAA